VHQDGEADQGGQRSHREETDVGQDEYVDDAPEVVQREPGETDRRRQQEPRWIAPMLPGEKEASRGADQHREEIDGQGGIHLRLRLNASAKLRTGSLLGEKICLITVTRLSA